MAERELLVRIVGDDRDLQRALRNTERSTARTDQRLQSFGKSVKGAFAFAGISVGTAAVFSLMEQSVSAASDLNEQLSRTKVILGDASAETIAWSTTTARSMGISQRAALAATSTFAGLFQTVGVQQAEAGRLSQALVQLAADLASLQNSSPEEALVALRSGLAGEAEPLRRFNIFLTEARVQQEALAETGKKTTSALTAQEKTLARYNLILKDSASAQGNFADTSGGLANQQRILAAEVDDLSTKLGSALVPALTGVVGALNDAVTAAGNLVTGLQALANLPVIEIPIKFAFGGGRGAELFQDIVLGAISPGALGAKIAGKLGAFSGATLEGVPTPVPGGREGHESPAVTIATAKAKADQARAARELEQSRKRFAEFIKGLGLKLDTAELSSGLGDDIAVLREVERRIQRQIATEGRTFKLAQALVDVRGQIASKIREQQDRQEEAATAAAQAAADKAQSEREKRKRINEQAARDRQADIFEELGLTRSGDQRTPSSGALLRRARSLQDQIKGTPLDAGKVGDQLRRIVGVLKAHFKNAGKEVRQAILGMLNDISSALEGKGSGVKQGPLTATHGLRSAQIIKNLGLTVEQADEIQRRLAHATVGGNLSRINGGGVGPIRTVRPQGEHERIVVESHTNLYLDKQVVASVVTREQQRSKRRNPKQKRGPNRG